MKPIRLYVVAGKEETAELAGKIMKILAEHMLTKGLGEEDTEEARYESFDALTACLTALMFQGPTPFGHLRRFTKIMHSKLDTALMLDRQDGASAEPSTDQAEPFKPTVITNVNFRKKEEIQ